MSEARLTFVCSASSSDHDDPRPETPGVRATLKTRSAHRPLPTHARSDAALARATMHAHCATAAHCCDSLLPPRCHTVTLCRTASSPRRLSRYSDHAAVARLQLYHTAAAGATATSPLSLPKPLLLVPPAPSSLAPVNNKQPGPAAATPTAASTPATATPPLRPRRRLATPAAAARHRQALRLPSAPKGRELGGGSAIAPLMA
jgi:hypothetical protein